MLYLRRRQRRRSTNYLQIMKQAAVSNPVRLDVDRRGSLEQDGLTPILPVLRRFDSCLPF